VETREHSSKKAQQTQQILGKHGAFCASRDDQRQLQNVTDKNVSRQVTWAHRKEIYAGGRIF
jgi:hypothetical protein